jgi:hypothetical protein
LKVFLEQQHKFRDQLNNLLGQTPWSMLSDMTERNIDLWQTLQARAASTEKPAPAAEPAPKKPPRKRR